jgi:rhamnopyranosyl-N-acetylglucosaminyl-diphospho-decaprenol beta-1,3/1,4-galactofuranosyltransferase
MSGTERIVAVVVTCDRLTCLKRCLEALRAQTRPPDHIVVVDNNSSDGTSEWLGGEDRIAILRLTENRGSAGGQRAGWQHALSSCAGSIWAMDDDCVPSPTALEKLLEARGSLPDPEDWALSCLAKDEASGQCGPLVRTEPGIPVRPCAADVFLSPENLPNLSGGIFQNWGHFFLGVLFPAKMIREIGLPEEAYFIRGEDYEYLLRCLRRKKAGVVLNSVMFHPMGAKRSLGQAGKKLFFEIRNHVAIDREYFPGPSTSYPAMLARCLRDMIRAPRLAGAIAHAYWSGVRFQKSEERER